MIRTVGSVCSGIEAASIAWTPLGFQFKWFSEIAPFPSRVLKEKYPNIINVGDMNYISDELLTGKIYTPDLICGGTPCQAFSLAGLQSGLNDNRANLTLKFVDIVEANDKKRLKKGLDSSIVLWENVEGVLTDKTNAFGCMVSVLAGFNDIIDIKKWSTAGLIRGPKRNIAWRVLDSKYFGLPQQRRRLYLLAGGINFNPESVLFETQTASSPEIVNNSLCFEKDGNTFEVFRAYTDCLYSAYGTKWNGNAAAYNGSLFVVQNGRIRRLSPLECERLMGFPDNYTNLKGATKTNRYQAIGNSWAVPVIRWIGERLITYEKNNINLNIPQIDLKDRRISSESDYIDFNREIFLSNGEKNLNCSPVPTQCVSSSITDIISADAPDDIYISPVGCYGILRRKEERNLNINKRLEEVLTEISSTMAFEDIEKRSRVQKRGKFSDGHSVSKVQNSNLEQISLFVH